MGRWPFFIGYFGGDIFTVETFEFSLLEITIYGN